MDRAAPTGRAARAPVVITDGVITDGVTTDGVITDGVTTDGVITDGARVEMTNTGAT